MKPLWDELRPLLGSIAAFSFIINLLFLVPALYMLQVFDRVLPSNNRATLLVLMLGSVLALLILFGLDFVRTRLQNVLGSLIDERLSPPVVNVVVTKVARGLNTTHFEAMRDVAALRNVFSNNGLVAVFDTPWVIIYVFVIGAFHPWLGVGAAVAAGLMLLIAWLNDRVSRNSLETLQRDHRGVGHYLESSLRNAEVLQALGMTERLLGRWRERNTRLTVAQIAASREGVAFAAASRFLRQAIQIFMLGLGAYLVLTGMASPGSMIATTILLGRAVQPVEQLVGSWRTLGEGRAAYLRLRDLSKDFESGRAMPLPQPAGMLSVEAVSFRAPGTERVVLQGVTFRLAAGEALAVVGPSAAGKSTLVRLLTGIWAPNSGAVRLDGVDVSKWSRAELGPWIGYVPQDVELFDGTVAENIARLQDVDPERVVEAARRARIHELVLTLPQGYDTQVGERGSALSPGQRQRVAFARALYGSPKVVLLDEPNSNLDGAGEVSLAQSLAKLRSEGVTTVVVTHRPSLIAHVDKILMLNAGRVAKFGRASDIMAELQREAQQAVAQNAA